MKREKPDKLPQPNMTQEEVAEALGTTRAMIADIEKKALRRLKIRLLKRNLKLDDLI